MKMCQLRPRFSVRCNTVASGGLMGVCVTKAPFTPYVSFPVSSFQGNSAQSETNVHLLSLRDENLPDLRKEAGAGGSVRLFGPCQPVPAYSAPHPRPDL